MLLKNSMPVLSANDPMDAIFSGVGYSILIVIALFQSGSWSKQLMGV